MHGQDLTVELTVVTQPRDVGSRGTTRGETAC
jgi:hypothetical protein